MSKFLKGNEIQLFAYTSKSAWVALPYATSNSLSMSTDTEEISSKDHGLHPDKEVTKQSFELSGEYLNTADGFSYLLGMNQSAGTYLFAFGQIDADQNWKDGLNGVTNTGDTTAWSMEDTNIKYAKGMVTSFEVSADDGANSTLSVTITGSGALMDTPDYTGIEKL